MVEPGRSGPVAGSARNPAIDVLRGVAVLGILGTNVQHYAMFAGVVRNPTLYGRLDGADLWVWLLNTALVFQKFLPILSMLFGAGIVMMAERAASAGSIPATALHYRRMTALLLIALAHSYLIWYGDILFTYALCGMALFPLRRCSPRVLIGLGVAMLAMFPLIRFLFLVLPGMLGIVSAGGPSVDEIVARDLEAFRGPWIEQFRLRAEYVIETQTTGFLAVLFWRAGGLMCIGMALYKLGVLTGRRDRKLYGILVLLAFAVALPVTGAGLSLLVATDWKSPLVRELVDQVIYWFGIVQSLGYVGIVMLLCRPSHRRGGPSPLEAVGRMALTNYLGQSVICTLLFYGHGLGLYGRVERTGLVAVVLGVWAVQLIASTLWLRFFRFGPAEWVWRSISYAELQPFRRRAAMQEPPA